MRMRLYSEAPELLPNSSKKVGGHVEPSAPWWVTLLLCAGIVLYWLYRGLYGPN